MRNPNHKQAHEISALIKVVKLIIGCLITGFTNGFKSAGGNTVSTVSKLIMPNIQWITKIFKCLKKHLEHS